MERRDGAMDEENGGMTHLDEGQIHAWLDGALDEREASTVEAHVASCSACRERVAEARGLIAASSRIVSALDDVPSGVIPARAVRAAPTATPNVASTVAPAAAARPTRYWWRTGVAAAATLFVAVGGWAVMRHDESATTLARSESFAADSVAGPMVASSPAPAAAASAPVMSNTRRDSARAPESSAGSGGESDLRARAIPTAPPPAPVPPAVAMADAAQQAPTRESLVSAREEATKASPRTVGVAGGVAGGVARAAAGGVAGGAAGGDAGGAASKVAAANPVADRVLALSAEASTPASLAGCYALVVSDSAIARRLGARALPEAILLHDSASVNGWRVARPARIPESARLAVVTPLPLSTARAAEQRARQDPRGAAPAAAAPAAPFAPAPTASMNAQWRAADPTRAELRLVFDRDTLSLPITFGSDAGAIQARRAAGCR